MLCAHGHELSPGSTFCPVCGVHAPPPVNRFAVPVTYPSAPPVDPEERRRRRRRTALVVALATPLVAAAIGVVLLVVGVFGAFVTLAHGLQGDRVLKPGRAPAPYPSELVAAYGRSAVAHAGCPLLQGRAAGIPTYTDMTDSFAVTYPLGLTVVFSTRDPTDDTETTPLPGTPWRGQVRSVDSLTTLVDGLCQVSVMAFLDKHADADELAVALSLRPVPGPLGALRPQPPSLAEQLLPTFGEAIPGISCGEADIDVAGARATPGCHSAVWPEYTHINGSDMSLRVERYATVADARYQFGIQHRYMRQDHGTTSDDALPGVPHSFLILTNRGQQCEASFVEGRFVVTVNASAPYAGVVPTTARAAVRADIVTARSTLRLWETGASGGRLI